MAITGAVGLFFCSGIKKFGDVSFLHAICKNSIYMHSLILHQWLGCQVKKIQHEPADGSNNAFGCYPDWISDYFSRPPSKAITKAQGLDFYRNDKFDDSDDVLLASDFNGSSYFS